MCTVCPKQFTRAHYLTEHMVQHSDKKPVVCPHCQAKCIDLTALQKHLKRHKQYRSDKHKRDSSNISVELAVSDVKVLEIPEQESEQQQEIQFVLTENVETDDQSVLQHNLLNFQIEDGALIINATEDDDSETVQVMLNNADELGVTLDLSTLARLTNVAFK